MEGSVKVNNHEHGTYFDKLGDDFELMMSDYDVQRRQVLVFEQLLGGRRLDGLSVLEVGCGTGRFSRRIAALGANLTVLDIGPNLVKTVSEQVGCKGVVGDACKLPFADETFDTVISSECIEHTPDPLAAIREMCRVCKKGGTVCFTTPNRLWYPVLWLSVKLRVRKFAGPERWIFPGTARKVMAAAGMGEMVVSGCHLWPFQLKFTRGLLARLDRSGATLYPAMINFGIAARKLPTSAGGK